MALPSGRHGHVVGLLGRAVVAAEVRGVDQAPGRRQLGDERVVTGARAVSLLEGVRGHGEAVAGAPGDVGVSRRIDGDGRALVVAGAAEERGVDQPVAGGIQLGDEDIGAASERPVVRDAGREVRRSGLSDDVGRARGVDGHVVGGVVSSPAKEAGVDDDRVDDERSRRVVRSDVESDAAIGGDDVPRGHVLWRIAVALVRERPRLSHHAVADMQQQFAGGLVHGDPIDPVEGQANRPPVGSGGDHEVVLESPLVAVVDDVDSRVCLGVCDPTEGGDAGAPRRWRIAVVVVDLPGRPGRHGRHGTGTPQRQGHRGGALSAVADLQDRPGSAQRDEVPSPACDVRRIVGRRAGGGLELQGESSVGRSRRIQARDGGCGPSSPRPIAANVQRKAVERARVMTRRVGGIWREVLAISSAQPASERGHGPHLGLPSRMLRSTPTLLVVALLLIAVEAR